MPGRSQFSIRFLLLLTVAVAAGVAVYRAEPSLKSLLVWNGLTMLYATAALIGAVQTVGSARAFWIGTAAVLAYGAAVTGVWSWQAASVYGLDAIVSPGYYGRGRQVFVWCAAPVNGFFAVFLHWVFSPRTNDNCTAIDHTAPTRAVRLPRTTVIALAIFPLLLLLGAAFFGGMLFGERRERDRRDQEERDEEAAFERKWRVSTEAAE
jgi:hypothetical protein